MKIYPESCCDFYKTGHIFQYEPGTEFVDANLTARSSRLAPGIAGIFDDKVVVFGLQGFIKEFLIDTWNNEFFGKPKKEVIDRFTRRMDTSLGPKTVTPDHIASLHDLGYLPLRIKALPEGAKVPIKVPFITIRNTNKNYFWLTNFIETVMSAEVWKPINNATTAYKYRLLIDSYTKMTSGSKDFVPWQGHDFSFRGMSGVHDAAVSGAAHLLSFLGTDTIPAIDYLEEYYHGRATFVGGSVPATEHSVACMGGQEDEIGTLRRLITKVYPTGIVSFVADTWDFWKVLTVYARDLKSEILARQPNALGQAKVVFRPDSGDPVKIICGDPDAPKDSPQQRGAVQCLWDVFGGTTNEKGYRTLNQRVGLIYGDSITLYRARDILERLEKAGFASDNIVFGIGSYTYQYATRDGYGMAIKATYGVVNGEGRELFKNPVTDSGTKKSAKGLLVVERDAVNGYKMRDQVTEEEAEGGELKTVFEDSLLLRETNLTEIRQRLLG